MQTFSGCKENHKGIWAPLTLQGCLKTHFVVTDGGRRKKNFSAGMENITNTINKLCLTRKHRALPTTARGLAWFSDTRGACIKSHTRS